jgi:AcrR family transcriptional regulator
MAHRTFGDRELSPNQEFRRAELIDAACRLLRTRRVAACTVRAVADEAGISKGAVNYYFKDVSELIDLGFLRLAHNFYDHVREQASRADDPVEALWRTVVMYVTPWGLHSGMGLLWAEYYLDGVRSKRLDGVLESQQAMVGLFTEALAKVSAAVEVHGPALTRHVTGAILSEPHVRISTDDFVAEVSRLIEVAPPTTTEFGCDAPDCPFHSGTQSPSGNDAGAEE